MFEETVNGYTFKVQFDDDKEHQRTTAEDSESLEGGSSAEEAEQDQEHSSDLNPDIFPAGLRWNHTVAELGEIIKEATAQLDKIIKGIISQKAHSFENTIVEMARFESIHTSN